MYAKEGVKGYHAPGEVLYKDNFKTVYYLTRRHRVDVSPSGALLAKLLDILLSTDSPNEAQVGQLCDALNDRAIKPAEWPSILATCPRVVGFRHSSNDALFEKFTGHFANAKKERLIRWSSEDSVPSSGAPIGPNLKRFLRDCENKYTCCVPAQGHFYTGARYIFRTSKKPLTQFGFATNVECIAHSIVLDPREPADDGTGSEWRLKYLPTAIIVRPMGVDVPALACEGVPDGCLVVEPMQTRSFQAKGFRVVRKGFPLGNGDAVTDYYAQGLTFIGPWLANLSQPPEFGLRRSGIVVIVSRYSTLHQLRLVQPLYGANDRLAVIKRWTKMLQLPAELRTEILWLCGLANKTRAANSRPA